MESSSGIHVDIRRGDNGNVPLCAETDGETLLRIPHGTFSVSITAQRPVDIKIDLDDAPAFATRVRGGSTVIDGDDDQVPLVFGESSAVESARTHVTRTGRVAVSVRHAATRPVGENQPVESPWETFLFRFCTAGADFNEAVAGALGVLKMPVSDPESGCGTYDADPLRSGNHPREVRW